jgi:hypothetical protein
MDKEQSRLEPQGRRMGDNNDDDDLWWWEVVVVVVVLGKKMREGSNHQPPRNVTLHSPMASSWEFQTLASHKLKQRVRRNRILESCNMVVSSKKCSGFYFGHCGLLANMRTRTEYVQLA